MIVLSRRPLALLICCLFAGVPVVHAAPATADPATGMRLERRFNLLAREKEKKEKNKAQREQTQRAASPTKLLANDDEYPLFLTADHLEGETELETRARGNVELRKPDLLLLADRLNYRPLDDEAEAIGQVHLKQGAAEIDTEYLKIRLTEQIGHTEAARYQIERSVQNKFYDNTRVTVTVASINGANSGAPMMMNIPNTYGLPTEAPAERPSTASGSAERIDLAGENHFLFDRATFSTCKPGSTDWYLQASKMDLDFDKDFGSADHASVWFQGAPLFYTPKIWFPLNNRRRSGLLAPTFKQSTKSGFDFTQPYYWNIAPNYDATFYPRYMSKRGTQLGAEIRYLGEGMESEVRGEYLGNDKKFLDRSRYGYSVRHQQTLAPGLSAYVNWNGVSDDWYWEDMSSRLLQTSQVQLERQLTLGYTPAPWLSSSLQVLRYQTLQPDPENPIARPYFLEPRLNLSGYKTNLLGALDFTLLGQYSRFTHDDRDNKAVGDRLVFYPQLSWPVVASAFRLQPKIGLHMTSYAVDEARINGGKRESFSRVLPTFSFDSTLILEREDELLGNAYIQTLEPRLYYVYIPYKKQDHIPVFDTGISDFDFAQIFSENRYVGYDRVNDAHQLTAALTTRILDADTGAERFKAMLGQRYYFARQRVQLPGEAQRPANFSNLVASITGLVAPKTYAEGTWEYNYKDRINERFSAGVRFQPDYGKVLSASYRYTRDPLNQKGLVDQVDISGQWPLAPRWYGVGRVNYSLRDKQTLETIAGLEYNAGCWAVRAVAQRLSATSGAPDTSFFLQLELQDFASVGSNPLSLLRRSIPGYGKTNELAPDSF